MKAALKTMCSCINRSILENKGLNNLLKVQRKTNIQTRRSSS